MVQVKIVNNSSNLLPAYATNGAAGMDLQAELKDINSKFFHYAEMDEEKNTLLIFSGGRALIPTNLFVSIPDGYELQIRPRSGLALKEGITVLNTPGTIDSDYRGNIGVILFNTSDDVFEVKSGDRIAQAVLNKFETIEWSVVETLNETERGEGGFGSTGK